MNRLSRLACAIYLSLGALTIGHAAEPELKGLWFEADNYPASSVLRFEKLDELWVGTYVKVSPAQKSFGFAVGESVIRGRFDGKEFTGHVLLKSSDPRFACPDQNVGWVPIKMTLMDSEHLHGTWLQTWADPKEPCRVVAQAWQPYRLEKLPRE